MNKLITITLLIIAPSIWGQTDPDEGGLNNSSTTVFTKVERYVARSNRVVTQPKIIDTAVIIPAQDYARIEKQEQVLTTVDPIKAARLKIVQPISKLYNSYAKVGFGNYLSPYVDLHFMEKRSRAGMWGANLRHFSSRDAHKDLHFSGFSDNHVSLYGTRFFERHQLSGKAKFDYDGVHQYGTQNDTSITRAQIRQRFYNYQIDGRYKSYYEDSTHLDKDINIGYYYFRDHKDTKDSAKVDYGREHHFNIGAQMGKYANKEYFQGDINLDYNQAYGKQINPCPQCDIPYNAEKRGNAILGLGFRVITQRDKFRVKAGLKIDIDMPDHRTSNPKLYAFPDAEVKYSLFNDIFVPYVGVTRELRRNSYKTLANENPFVLSNIELINTNNAYKIYGGFKGTLSRKTDFGVGINYGKYNSVPLFITDTLLSFDNRFEVVYDTFNITNIFAEVSFHKGEVLKIYAKGDYYMYSQGREEAPWYMPEYKISLNATYDMSDKIIVRLKTYILGGRKASNIKPIYENNGTTINDLGAFVDVNLGAEYRYTKRLSAFLNFNNILSKKYQLYQNYPLQGINILGGITWSF